MSRIAVVIAWLLALLVLVPATAQQARPAATTAATTDVFTYFYKDPRPERLIGYIQTVDSAANSWDSFPPLVGFLAFVFQAHPDWIDRLIPDQLNSRTAPTVAAALRLSGNAPKLQALQPRLAKPIPDPRLASELAGLPTRLEDVRITVPTHLDILWGAAFASGDARFVRPILDYYAAMANRSDAIAEDVWKTASAIGGGPQGTVAQLRPKYGDALTVQIIYAGSALWGLASNARQHAFVQQAVIQYIGQHPNTPATINLAPLLLLV